MDTCAPIAADMLIPDGRTSVEGSDGPMADSDVWNERLRNDATWHAKNAGSWSIDPPLAPYKTAFFDFVGGLER